MKDMFKIQERVTRALNEDERTQDYGIEVISESGMVTLKGEVDSAEARQAAEEIAAEQEGVIEVINSLEFREEKRNPEGNIILPINPMKKE